MIITQDYGDIGGFEQLSPTSATGITASVRAPTSGTYNGHFAKAALIVVETNAIRFRCDGTDPTDSVGMYVSPGMNFMVVGVNNVKNFSCIDVSGASTVDVQVYF